MIWLLVIVWVIGGLFAIALASALIIGFVVIGALFLLGSFTSFKITGRWPSDRTITWLAGSLATAFFTTVAPSPWVFVGGVIGTWLVAREASPVSYRADHDDDPPPVYRVYERDDI